MQLATQYRSLIVIHEIFMQLTSIAPNNLEAYWWHLRSEALCGCRLLILDNAIPRAALSFGLIRGRAADALRGIRLARTPPDRLMPALGHICDTATPCPRAPAQG